MRPRRGLALAVAVSLPLLVVPLAAVPATARTVDAAGPAYELPFPCAQQWTGTTRAAHRPSRLSVDLNRPDDLGDLTVASAPGVVSRVADTGGTGYGRYLVVDHGGGHSTLYAHLRSIWTTLGQRVDQGTILGVVGATGGVSGAHLHLEQRVGSEVQHPSFHGLAYPFGTTLASANCPDVPLAGDWDGDGVDEVAVFRRGGGPGVFRLSRSEATPEAIPFGRSSDTPVAGDWDGDGRTDIGVRRPGRRTFLLRHADGTSTSVRLGTRKDVPVTGDWDGDGATDVGVWRPASAGFRLRDATGALTTVTLGTPGSVPVTGDWDGNGSCDVGVFDPATASFTLRTVSADGTPSFSTVRFGSGADIPVTGDWDGDGVSDVGTWTPSTATYSLRTAAATGRTTAVVTSQRMGRRR